MLSDFSGHCSKCTFTPIKFTNLRLYRSWRLWHLVRCQSLHVDRWWHLLLQRGRQRSRAQGHALRLDLHLDLSLSWSFHDLRLLLGKLQSGRHGAAGRLQPPRQLRRRGVQAGGVLHRGAFGRVVLLLALLLPRQLHGLRSGRHSTCTARGNTALITSKHPTLSTDIKRKSVANRLICYLLCHKTP